jgi:hypothetical protein
MELSSQLSYVMCSFRGRDRVVHTATRYGLDSLGIESRWGKTSHTRPDQPWDPPRLLSKGFQVFPGEVKRPGPGVYHPPPSSAKVKERVEIYIYYHSGSL